MALADVNVGNGLQKGYAVGAGVETGLLKPIGDKLVCHLRVNDTHYVAGDSHNEFEAMIAVNYSVKRNLSFGVEISRTVAHDFYVTEGSLYGNFYF